VIVAVGEAVVDAEEEAAAVDLAVVARVTGVVREKVVETTTLRGEQHATDVKNLSLKASGLLRWEEI